MMKYSSLSSLQKLIDETVLQNCSESCSSALLTEDFVTDRILPLLRSNQLIVPDEDTVFDYIVYLSSIVPLPIIPALWASIRYVYLSNDYVTTWILPWLTTTQRLPSPPNESPTIDVAPSLSIGSKHPGGLVKIPFDVLSCIEEQVKIRNERIHAQMGMYRKFGSLSMYGTTTTTGTPLYPSTVPTVVLNDDNSTKAWMEPRDSYCFSLDIYGTNQRGTGGGLFYVWLNPDHPLEPNTTFEPNTTVTTSAIKMNNATSSSTDKNTPIGTTNDPSITDDTVSQTDHQAISSSSSLPSSTVSTDFSTDELASSLSTIISQSSGTTDSSRSTSSSSADPGGTIPAKYIKNIREWETKYGTRALLFDGKQCALAVKEISTYPEFYLPISIRLPSVKHIYNVESTMTSVRMMDNSKDSSIIHLSSLWDIYQYYANTGNWIQCVDIARLCLLWLMGSPSLYLDTDIEIGEACLPRELFLYSHENMPPEDTSSFLSSSRPLLILPQDTDGVLQNNVLGLLGGDRTLQRTKNTNVIRNVFSASFSLSVDSMIPNPFLTLLIQSILVNSVYEHHVIHATGPALLTALFHIFRNTTVQVTNYVQQTYGKENRNDYDPLLSTVDLFIDRIRSRLPQVHESEYIFCLSRIYQTSFGATVDKGAKLTTDPDAPFPSFVLFKRLEEWTYGDFVHILPATAFFPTHWRNDGPVDNESTITKISATITEKSTVPLRTEKDTNTLLRNIPLPPPVPVTFPFLSPPFTVTVAHKENESQNYPPPLPPATIGFGPMVSYSGRYATLPPTVNSTGTEGVTSNAERQLLQIRVTHNNPDPNDNNNDNNNNRNTYPTNNVTGLPSTLPEQDGKETVPVIPLSDPLIVPPATTVVADTTTTGTNPSPSVLNYGRHRWDCTWGKGNTGYYLSNVRNGSTNKYENKSNPSDTSNDECRQIERPNACIDHSNNPNDGNNVHKGNAFLRGPSGYTTAVSVLQELTNNNSNVESSLSNSVSTNDSPHCTTNSSALISTSPDFLLSTSSTVPSSMSSSSSAEIFSGQLSGLPLVAKGPDVFNVASLGYRTLYRMATNDFVSLPPIPPSSLLQSLFPRTIREYRLPSSTDTKNDK